LPRSVTQSVTDASITPPAVGGLFSLVTRELFRFEDLGLGEPGVQWLSIGAAAECHIVLDDPCVSSMHAAVTCIAAHTFRLLDLRSRNGVLQIVHRRAKQIHCVDIALGQRFVFGRTTLVCVTEAGHAPLTAFDVRELESLCGDVVTHPRPVNRSPQQDPQPQRAVRSSQRR
jgi:hypothetical protein